MHWKKLVTRERSSTDRRCIYGRLDRPLQDAAAQCFESFTKRALAQLVESLDRTRERMNQQQIERSITE